MSIKKNGKTIAGNYTVANIKDFKNELAVTSMDVADVPEMKSNTDMLLEHIENLNDYRLFTKYCNSSLVLG